MKYCQFNGCNRLVTKGAYCNDHKAKKRSKKRLDANDVYHHKNKPFYKTDSWQEVRSFVYERQKGLCQRCNEFIYGRRAHCHHIVPIKDNPDLSLDPNNIRLLCPQCHVIEEHEEDKEAVFPSYFNSLNKN